MSDNTVDIDLDGERNVTALAIAPAGDWLAVGDSAGNVQVIPMSPP